MDDDKGRLLILEPRNGFPYNEDHKMGLDLLDTFNSHVVTSLQFKKSFIMKAERKLESSIKKVSNFF